MKITEFFKKDYIIGLDIGTSSVKMVQFADRQDGLCLVKAHLKEIKQTDDALREREIIAILKDLFRTIDLKKSKVILSINCPETAVKRINVPHMPKAELKEGIRLEAKNYFPFSIDDAFLDFEILDEVVEKGVKKYKLLVATSSKNTVDKYISLLKKAGIKLTSFIPTSLAIQKAAQALHPRKDEVRAFLDIGKQFAEFVIIEGTDLVFSRKIPIAGDDFTKAMTETLVSDKGRIELTFEEAREIKETVGIPAGEEVKIVTDKISAVQILSMLRAPLDQLVNEIDRGLYYYRESYAGAKVESLTLLGGGALLKGLADFLLKELGIPVKVGDPLFGIKIKPGVTIEKEKTAPRLSSALGAALNRGQGINLLPAEIKEETKRTIKRTTLEVIATSVILILVLVNIDIRIRLDNFRKRITAAEIELTSLEPQIKEAELQNLANNILADEPYWEDVFKDLGNIIPNNIYLTGLTKEGKLIRMRGVVVSIDPERTLSNFILDLEKGIFDNVKLVTTKKAQGESSNKFELTCWLD